MIVAALSGGLGNQLFQYAAARSLSLTNKAELFLDLSFFDKSPNREYQLGYFNIKARIASRKKIYEVLNEKKYLLNLFTGKKPFNANHPVVFSERFFHFNEDFNKIKMPVFLQGYWQSEKYFSEHAGVISEELQFKNNPALPDVLLLEEIKNTNSVSIHIRRGDYVSNSEINAIHGICNDDYYIAALNKLKELTGKVNVFIFSDDDRAAEGILSLAEQGKNVSRINKGNQLSDFYLMQQCKHNIIANSSFSWWAAWMNRNPEKKIIAPRKWFKDSSKNTVDLYPPAWLIL